MVNQILPPVTIPVTPASFAARRYRAPQLAENPTALSPFPATLTSLVNHNPFLCHSCRKHPGWGAPINQNALLSPHLQAALGTFSTFVRLILRELR